MGHKIPRRRSKLHKLRVAVGNIETMIRCNGELKINFPQWSFILAGALWKLEEATAAMHAEEKRTGTRPDEGWTRDQMIGGR